MKFLRLFLPIYFFLPSNYSFSQKVTNTTGNTIADNSLMIEYSVGEISINTLIDQSSANASFITQGLLQPSLKIIPPPCDLVKDTIQYFPNPTRGILSVVTRFDWISAYKVYASDGKLIRASPFINNQIDITNLPAGIYFIRILPGCESNFRILKVIKQ